MGHIRLQSVLKQVSVVMWNAPHWSIQWKEEPSWECWARATLLASGSPCAGMVVMVKKVSLLLSVSSAVWVSWAHSWPGACGQSTGFPIREFFQRNSNNFQHFNNFSYKIRLPELERISRTLRDLTLLTIINSFPFDPNQSPECF